MHVHLILEDRGRALLHECRRGRCDSVSKKVDVTTQLNKQTEETVRRLKQKEIDIQAYIRGYIGR